MKLIKFKLNTYPSVNYLNKLVSLFSSVNSVVCIKIENEDRKVSAKSLIGMLSLKLRIGQIICISFYGDSAEEDADYIKMTINTLK